MIRLELQRLADKYVQLLRTAHVKSGKPKKWSFESWSLFMEPSMCPLILRLLLFQKIHIFVKNITVLELEVLYVASFSLSTTTAVMVAIPKARYNLATGCIAPRHVAQSKFLLVSRWFPLYACFTRFTSCQVDGLTCMVAPRTVKCVSSDGQSNMG